MHLLDEMSRFLLIRHGETDHVGRMLSGRTPGIHLNARGRAQAQSLAKWLGTEYEDPILVSSPLERAQETARFFEKGRPIISEPALTELDFGDWTGLTFPELEKDPLWEAYNRTRSIVRPPRGEAPMSVQARAWTCLLEWARRNRDSVFFAFTHADVIRSALAAGLGMPLDHLLRLRVDPCSVSEIVIDDGVQIGYVNRTVIEAS